MKSIVVFGSGSIAESYAKHLEYDNNYTLLMHMRDISEIKKLSNITFHKENYSVNKPIGKTLILHQKNGDMICAFLVH